MDIKEQLLNKMIAKQMEDNKKFLNMDTIRVDQVEEIHIDIELGNKATQTELFVVGELLVLKRFIKSKLIRVEFNKNIFTIDDLVVWTDLSDYDFVKCASLHKL